MRAGRMFRAVRGRSCLTLSHYQEAALWWLGFSAAPAPSQASGGRGGSFRFRRVLAFAAVGIGFPHTLAQRGGFGLEVHKMTRSPAAWTRQSGLVIEAMDTVPPPDPEDEERKREEKERQEREAQAIQRALDKWEKDHTEPDEDLGRALIAEVRQKREQWANPAAEEARVQAEDTQAEAELLRRIQNLPQPEKERVIGQWHDTKTKIIAPYVRTGGGIGKLPERAAMDLRRIERWLRALEPESVRREALVVENQSALEATPVPAPESTSPVDDAASANRAPQLGSGAKHGRRGPSRDYETAKKVAAMVAPFAPQWQSGVTLDNVLMALDDEEIPIPKTWRKKHDLHTWTDAGRDSKTRHLARKAIQHHLALARDAGKL